MNILKKLLTRFFSFEDMERIRSLIAWALYHSGLGFLLSKLIGKKGATILVYHSVGGIGVFWDNVIKTKVFENQLNYLSQYRTVVKLSDIIEMKRMDEAIPHDWVAITFDDGYKDYALNAAPLLRQHNFPSTVFICSSTFSQSAELFFDQLNRIISKTQKDSIKVDFAGHIQEYDLRSVKRKHDATLKLALILREFPTNIRVKCLEYLSDLCDAPKACEKADYYLSEADIKKLDSLTSIGSHSVSHPNLASLDIEELTTELQASKTTLQNIVGDKQKINLFAYPFGKPWSFNDKVKNALANSGYHCAVTTCHSYINHSDIYELPRIGADNSLSRFKLNLSGVMI